MRRVFSTRRLLTRGAVDSLQALKDEEWGDRVTVVAADMRVWQAPEQADILVSELLGSFGDNELSPECLDGAQRVLKDGGVSIPQKYTSYLALLSSSTLFNAVKAQPCARSRVKGRRRNARSLPCDRQRCVTCEL